jgi:hypothetical protein
MIKPAELTIEKRPESKGDFVAYNVYGVVTIDDVKEIHEDLRCLFDRHKKLKLLVNIEDLQGMEPSAVLEDLKFTLHYLNDFSAMAIVGNKKWQEALADFSDVLLDYKIRFFPSGKINSAIEWLQDKKRTGKVIHI